MNDQVEDREGQTSNGDSPAGEPVEPTPPLLPSDRPNLEDLDRWVQKRLVLKLGAVVVIAFLFKSFVPIPYGFTVGLLTGLALLVAIYLISFHRRK